MVERGSRILDAGCGTGRVGGYLRRLGHTVVGVDVDPVLIDYAVADHPDAVWLAGDLAELDLPARGIADPFDVIVSAGNVMGFLAPSTRVEVLTRLRRHLAPGGRVIVGFGAGRGYGFDEYFNDLTEAGLVLEVALSSWDLRPFTAASSFLVSISSAEA